MGDQVMLPTFRVGRTVLWLDPESYVNLTEGNQLVLVSGSLSEQCEGCGQDIVESGNLLGNPGLRTATRVAGNPSGWGGHDRDMTTPGDDDCVVECECGATYRIEWKEVSRG